MQSDWIWQPRWPSWRHIVGVQRYAKKHIVIWKTRIAIHIAIHLVSSFLTITAPSSVLWYNSRVMKLASITHCHIFSYSFCPVAAFQGEMIEFVPSLLGISLQLFVIVCPPSFLKPKVDVAFWSNWQHKQIFTSFNNKASVFEMRK